MLLRMRSFSPIIKQFRQPPANGRSPNATVICNKIGGNSLNPQFSTRPSIWSSLTWFHVHQFEPNWEGRGHVEKLTVPGFFLTSILASCIPNANLKKMRKIKIFFWRPRHCFSSSAWYRGWYCCPLSWQIFLADIYYQVDHKRPRNIWVQFQCIRWI